MREYIKEILQKYYKNEYDTYFKESPVFQYLDLKSGAIDGNSKTRKSLANIYAIYSILSFYVNDFFEKKDDYLKFSGYEYTQLLAKCRSMYGGEKIQNHALNSRLNLEFDNKICKNTKNKGKYVIVQNNGKYLIHVDYLYVKGKDISKVVLEIIDKYINLLQQKDNDLINKLEKLSSEINIDTIKKTIESLLTEDSEARVFEIISYAILKNYYSNQICYFGYSLENIEKLNLKLYKTGRTNANDGGIDFVMRPVGRFFQVTEVGNYDKYFLDIDKILHYPMTFVIKTNKTQEIIKKEFDAYVKNKSGGMEVIVDKYTTAIEEIITINELKKWYNELDNASISSILADIIQYYKVEMNFYENINEDSEPENE